MLGGATEKWPEQDSNPGPLAVCPSFSPGAVTILLPPCCQSGGWGRGRGAGVPAPRPNIPGRVGWAGVGWAGPGFEDEGRGRTDGEMDGDAGQRKGGVLMDRDVLAYKPGRLGRGRLGNTSVT